MIPICEECHETDNLVIKCDKKKFTDHRYGVREGICEVCGKRKMTVVCYGYSDYVTARK